MHFAAAGAHGDHKQAVLVFTALALVQVGWGGLALVRRDAQTCVLGVLLAAVAVGGWLVAKTAGLPLIAGLDVPEPVQLADALAAALAALAGLLSAVALLRPAATAVPLWVTAGVMAVTTGVATVATSGHHHAAVGHTPAMAWHQHATTAAHVEAHPYDPSLPIDLSGTPGVTPQQQAAAERLVTLTRARLPQWADAASAERRGFRSIGDQFTGTEHLINQAFLTDSHTLDPDHPESLVYDTSGGGRRLVAAMYMLAPGTPLSAVPDLGGALVQWHVHDNLCFSPSGFVQGITSAAGTCPAGQVKPTPAPMVHVWITPNRCGPFAALEGIAGGTIAAGQTLCDHLHGSS